MGFLERFGLTRITNVGSKETNSSETDLVKEVVVGSIGDGIENSVQTFNNANITFQGNLEGFNYTSILRDKQKNIEELYQLSDYFIDSDPIYRGVVKHVYVPFSQQAKWRLTGADEKTREKYLEHYADIRLVRKLVSIFLQFYKYANVFCYVMEDGNIITLPVLKCTITNVTLNGEPLVEMDLSDLKDTFGGFGSNDKRYFDDDELKKQLLGYPTEVGEALVKGLSSVQLNPERTFVVQDTKEDWQRYAIPMIASFLPALSKKALIGKYEDALLNLGLRSFVHVKYGDSSAGNDILPDVNQLRQARNVFSKAMSGMPLAVTNHLASAEVIQANSSFLHEWDKYKEVNEDLLSAGGISGIVVTGVSSDGSTFASAQVSMKAAVARIEQMLVVVADMLTVVNQTIYPQVTGRKTGKAPVFTFMPLDPDGKKALQSSGLELWTQGVLSTKSLVEAYGYDVDEEVELRKKEDNSGTTDTLVPRNTSKGDSPKSDKVGRKTLDDDERTSDPENAIRGKLEKPSSPEGSMDNLEGEQ